MGRSYIIKQGDTLESIAKATGVSADDIALENGVSSAMSVDPNMMREGNTIFIPDLIAKTDGKKTEVTGGGEVVEGDNNHDAATGGGNKTTSSPFSYDDFSYADYVESETVKQADAALNAQLAQKPGAYQSKWQAQINDIINRILNREEFSYDLNGDALYQQYKDQYMRGGQRAMQDTMAEAAALTGGYGNSYASTAGNTLLAVERMFTVFDSMRARRANG